MTVIVPTIFVTGLVTLDAPTLAPNAVPTSAYVIPPPESWITTEYLMWVAVQVPPIANFTPPAVAEVPVKFASKT